MKVTLSFRELEIKFVVHFRQYLSRFRTFMCDKMNWVCFILA